LTFVLDLSIRQILRWAMRDHMRAELTIAVLTLAEPMLYCLLEDRRLLIHLELAISQ
jgi:hypothetical protein